MKASRMFAILTAVATLSLFLAAPLFAEHPASKSDIDNLRKRIKNLEAKDAPADEPFEFAVIGKHLRVGGLLELEAFHEKIEGGDEASDLALATAEMNIQVEINDHIGGHVILLHEEGEDLAIDEAVIALTHPFEVLGGELGMTGGKLYLPYGRFNSAFITDPLTLELGETNNTALLLGWASGGAELTLGAFSGETDTVGDHDTIDSWVASLDIIPCEGLTFGGSYISDIAESDIGLVTDTDLYTASVAGASAYLSASLGAFTLDVEYLTALESFDDAVTAVGEDLNGEKPGAWNIELAFAPHERWLLALKAESSKDFQDDLNRYGAVTSYGIFTNTVIALEYLQGDRDTEEDRSHTVTAQLAFQF